MISNWCTNSAVGNHFEENSIRGAGGVHEQVPQKPFEENSGLRLFEGKFLNWPFYTIYFNLAFMMY